MIEFVVALAVMATSDEAPAPPPPEAPRVVQQPLPPVTAYSPAPSSGQAIVTKPDWLRRPGPEDMARSMPDAAKAAEVGGRAIIVCKVKTNGTLEDCRVDSESPEGMGFGQAALRVSKLFKMKPTQKDGTPVEGRTIRVPIAWFVPGA